MRRLRGRRSAFRVAACLSAAPMAWAACGDDAGNNPVGPGDGPRFPGCDLDVNFLFTSAGRDAVESLDDAVWVRASEGVPDYLDSDTRVIGIEGATQPHAIPLNVLWHHEIVNLDLGGPQGARLAITHCPLTGSSLVFDRTTVGGATLGISGLLFMNNLVVYDRREPDESLWPQMMARAGCGPERGNALAQAPFVEMEWAEWLALHPETFVLAQDQGYDPAFFDYTRLGYPYGNYREVEAFFNGVFPQPLDTRRFTKERVVGVPSSGSDPGIAFPFGALNDPSGDWQAVAFDYEGEPAVLLWSDAAQGGSAYRPFTKGGQAVTLTATGTGLVDSETGSVWSIEGRALAGPLAGQELLPVETAYTAFWGAWAVFHMETRLWEG